MASSKIIAEKEEKVKALSEELKDCKLLLLVDYRGITVEEDTKLRKDLREAKGTSKVVKNNILKRALDMNGENGLDEMLVGPNTVIYSKEDYLAPSKVVYKFSKANENYVIKGGYIDGELKSLEEIMQLATLPSREELLSKLAGSLLQTIAKLAVALDQVKEKKESETVSVEAAPAAEAKAEEAPAAEEAAPAEEVKAEEAAPAAEEAPKAE